MKHEFCIHGIQDMNCGDCYPYSGHKTEQMTYAKPREFWLSKAWSDPDATPFSGTYYSEKQKTAKLETYIHVIEKSAYDELEKQLKLAREENELLMSIEYWKERHDTVDAELKKLKEQK